MGSLLLAIMLLAGCVQHVAAPDALYQQLGGSDGIRALVQNLLQRSLDDRRIAHHFADTDMERLEQKLVEQLCELSGGPCRYSGDTMEQVHGGFNISEGDFNALVENLQLAMAERGIAEGAQNRLLALLAPMRQQVIYR
jgi:hemoglobin